jgi:hypothetical protein
MATQVTLNDGSIDSAGSLALKTNGTTTAITIDTSQNVGIGTSSPATKLVLAGNNSGLAENNTLRFWDTDTATEANQQIGKIEFFSSDISSPGAGVKAYIGAFAEDITPDVYLSFATDAQTGTPTERARIDSSGNLLVGKTGGNISVVGCQIEPDGLGVFTADGAIGLLINRLNSDGDLVSFRQAGTQEGSISVSGTTVSYNGGHLSRWAQTITPKDESLVKGTVLSNLDEMNVYTDAEGNTVQNEQLNKVKVSDTEGDANVAGVFVNWTHDDAHDVDEINMAMTGDMIIRIAQGVAVQRGDLLMSAGDGTAKPQGDDIVRSKTVAKVTSTHVTCTYADGSYCVPCVLMAC